MRSGLSWLPLITNTFTFELKFYNLTTHQANMENEILSGYIYAKKTNCENIP